MDIANLLSGLGDAATGLLPRLVGQAAQRNLPSGLFAEALSHLLGRAVPELPATLPTSVAGTAGKAALSLLEGLTSSQPTAGGTAATGGVTQAPSPELTLLAGIVAWLTDSSETAAPQEATDGSLVVAPVAGDPVPLSQAIEEVLDSLDEALDGLLTQAGPEVREALAALAARIVAQPRVGAPVGILDGATAAATPEGGPVTDVRTIEVRVAPSTVPRLAEAAEATTMVAPVVERPRATITPELRAVVAELLERLDGRVASVVEVEAPQAPMGATAVPAPAPEPSVGIAEAEATDLEGGTTPAQAEPGPSPIEVATSRATSRPLIALEPEPERLYTRVARRSERMNALTEPVALSRSAAATNEVAASLTREPVPVQSTRGRDVGMEALGRLLERREPAHEPRARARVDTSSSPEPAVAAAATRTVPLETVVGNSWALPEQRAREAVRATGAMRVGLWNRVERAVQDTVASGKSAVVIELKPAHLGDVRVTISATEQSVAARFEAESQTVRAVLESNLPLLRDMLTNAGVDPSRLEVTVGFGGAGAHGGGGSGNRFADAQYRAFEPAARQGTETESARTPTVSAWSAPWRSSSAVDVLA